MSHESESFVLLPTFSEASLSPSVSSFSFGTGLFKINFY
uniref:Uncharacterized protein n=1 Tax=Anguilla anguilla TaxID=7936 RepID=A0A0E9W378_ANGAN